MHVTSRHVIRVKRTLWRYVTVAELWRTLPARASVLLEPLVFMYVMLMIIFLILISETLTVPAESVPDIRSVNTDGVYAVVFEARINALIAQNKTFRRWKEQPLKMCPRIPKHIQGTGHKHSWYNTVISDNMANLAKVHPDIRGGGSWEPRDCVARHRVAIIIPFRDRDSHLLKVLAYVVPLLKMYAIQFRIYVSEQEGNLTFNKGVLMNAAFIEALKDETWDCFVFHDVDLLPVNKLNPYSCPNFPRHLSVAIDQMNYELPYDHLVGGVLILRTEHFFKVNGYSNRYWGWGAEDDDMAKRIKSARLRIVRPPYNLARYDMIKHTKRKAASFKIRYLQLVKSRRRHFDDGVTSVKYELVQRTEQPMFTHLLINVGQPPGIAS